ncbi:MAG TPA: hypothetical protein H9673_02695 [Candidatus Adamsella sp.]|nr:hypothetical protein [Candidatus Adamsella sp.]
MSKEFEFFYGCNCYSNILKTGNKFLIKDISGELHQLNIQQFILMSQLNKFKLAKISSMSK